MDKNIKKALITGITGQDGSYLAELLLRKGYEVHGIIRRSSSFNTGRINHIFAELHLHYGDLTDSLSMDNIVSKIKPDEVYHLGAQSHVMVSFDVPKYTLDTDAGGTLFMLEAIRKHCPNAKFYNATTSELFGKCQEFPQNENTPFYPRSPYGVAKLYSYWICRNYREAYGLFVSNGILFNHESERRGETFVTRKITMGMANLSNNSQIVKMEKQSIPALSLGNLYSKRDWGYAPDFVEGMWRILQHEKGDEFILSTGETHSIKEFIEECLIHTPFNNKTEWIGEGINEKLMYGNIELININSNYYRPTEVDLLIGNYNKAKDALGWSPSTSFKGLVQKMMINDLKLNK